MPQNVRMPGEWEPHHTTWLAWPHNPKDWPGKFASMHWVYAEIVRHLTTGERVEILVKDAALQRRIAKMLADAQVELGQVGLHLCETDRSWTRDSGPTFVKRGSRLEAVCWQFNAWAKYENWKRDVKVAQRIAGVAQCPAVEPTWNGRRIVLEGGAIDSNGAGCLLTTEECLLSEVQRRNPGFTRDDYEGLFREFLGIDKVLWLAHGIVGDDTHGHVDDLARFVGPKTIATIVETNRKDDNYAILKANRKRLSELRNQHGKPFDIIELPMPRPLIFRGTRLPASYANFYIGNSTVLVPIFNDPNDRHALNALAAAFPKRDIIPIPAVDYAWGFGTLHCSTQQQWR
jgi:agmatine deiminase